MIRKCVCSVELVLGQMARHLCLRKRFTVSRIGAQGRYLFTGIISILSRRATRIFTDHYIERSPFRYLELQIPAIWTLGDGTRSGHKTYHNNVWYFTRNYWPSGTKSGSSNCKNWCIIFDTDFRRLVDVQQKRTFLIFQKKPFWKSDYIVLTNVQFW